MLRLLIVSTTYRVAWCGRQRCHGHALRPRLARHAHAPIADAQDNSCRESSAGAARAEPATTTPSKPEVRSSAAQAPLLSSGEPAE